MSNEVTLKLTTSGKIEGVPQQISVVALKSQTWRKFLSSHEVFSNYLNSKVFVSNKRYILKSRTRGWHAKLDEKIATSLKRFKKTSKVHLVKIWNLKRGEQSASTSNREQGNSRRQNMNDGASSSSGSTSNGPSRSNRDADGDATNSNNDNEEGAQYNRTYNDPGSTTWEENEELLREEGIAMDYTALAAARDRLDKMDDVMLMRALDGWKKIQQRGSETKMLKTKKWLGSSGRCCLDLLDYICPH